MFATPEKGDNLSLFGKARVRDGRKCARMIAKANADAPLRFLLSGDQG
jgi:hypothetical protein